MTDSATITVNVMGTFSEKNRPNNGLERVARYLNENRLSHVPIVAEIGFHKNSETLDGHVLTIKLLATEPGLNADGSDPNGYGKRIRELLDEIRKQVGKSAFEETLFSIPREGFDFDGDEGDGEMEGQGELRLTGDGPREVPEASGEELTAELDERRAAKPPATDPFTPGGAE